MKPITEVSCRPYFIDYQSLKDEGKKFRNPGADLSTADNVRVVHPTLDRHAFVPRHVHVLVFAIAVYNLSDPYDTICMS